MAAYGIGEISARLGIGIDTLRYYEKIGLLARVARNSSRQRVFDDRDISRLRFIQRAKKMNFTLAEIGLLLKMRADPQHARREARELARRKLAEVEERVNDLNTLGKELRLLINLCEGAKAGCPIIAGIEQKPDR